VFVQDIVGTDPFAKLKLQTAAKFFIRKIYATQKLTPIQQCTSSLCTVVRVGQDSCLHIQCDPKPGFSTAQAILDDKFPSLLHTAVQCTGISHVGTQSSKLQTQYLNVCVKITCACVLYVYVEPQL
jgi:hypothetical protein